MTDIEMIIRAEPQTFEKLITEMQTQPIYTKEKTARLKEEYPNVFIQVPVNVSIRPEFVKGFMYKYVDFVPHDPQTLMGWAKVIIRQLFLLPLRLMGFTTPPTPFIELKDRKAVAYSIMYIGVKKDVIHPVSGREFR